MKVSPIRSYRGPRFPTRGILDAHPELLRLVPKRWRANPVVLAALAATCAIATVRWGQACAEQTQPAVQVAPLFVHGEGSAAYGCMAVSPPVFLSEDEARDAVIQEAKAAGLTFTAPGPELKDVKVWHLEHEADGRIRLTRDAQGHIAFPKGPLVLDAGERAHRIGVEFVSQPQAYDWTVASGEIRASAYTVSTFAPAQELRTKIRFSEQGGAYGVFYEPLVSVDYAKGAKTDPNTGARIYDRKEAEAAAKEQAREELRKQVRDFIAWLKAQGIV